MSKRATCFFRVTAAVPHPNELSVQMIVDTPPKARKTDTHHGAPSDPNAYGQALLIVSNPELMDAFQIGACFEVTLEPIKEERPKATEKKR